MKANGAGRPFCMRVIQCYDHLCPQQTQRLALVHPAASPRGGAKPSARFLRKFGLLLPTLVGRCTVRHKGTARRDSLGYIDARVLRLGTYGVRRW